jgi:hypothetical protein
VGKDLRMHKTAKQRNHIWKKVTTIGDQNQNAVDSPGNFTVPKPATMPLLGLGLVALSCVDRIREKV